MCTYRLSICDANSWLVMDNQNVCYVAYRMYIDESSMPYWTDSTRVATYWNEHEKMC